MELSYKQLEMALAAHFRIHPDRIGTFRSRIRQLQRLEFPPDSRVGRGEKMKYSATHLFQFVAAFELINAGFTTGLVVEIVSDKWSRIAAGFGLVIRNRLQNELADIVYIRIMNCTFVELQGQRARAQIPNVFVEDEKSLAEILKRNDDRVVNSYHVICASDIVFSVLDCLRRVAQVDEPLAEIDASDWRVNVGFPEDAWMRAESGWFHEKVPSGSAPPFLSSIVSSLKYREPELSTKLIEDGLYGQEYSQAHFDLMQSYGMMAEVSSPRFSSPSRKGLAVLRYLKREQKGESDDGLNP